jgi:hypothetical protein
MKAYLSVTCVVFGLILLAHLARVVAEGLAVAADPLFLLSTAIAAAMFVWGLRLRLRFGVRSTK